MVKKKRSVILVTIGLVCLFVACSHLNANDKGGKDNGEHDSKGLLDFVKKSGAGALVVLGKDGISIVDPSGNKLRTCKTGENGKISKESREKCGNLQGIDILSAETISVIRFKHNPNCMWIRVGGRWTTAHDGSEPRWPRGAYKCHNNPVHPSF